MASSQGRCGMTLRDAINALNAISTEQIVDGVHA